MDDSYEKRSIILSQVGTEYRICNKKEGRLTGLVTSCEVTAF